MRTQDTPCGRIEWAVLVARDDAGGTGQGPLVRDFVTQDEEFVS